MNAEEKAWKAIEALTRQIDKVDKQIGGLNNKFGSFTEGMALPSMTKILNSKFHCSFVAPNVVKRKGSDSLELDVFAYSNGQHNEAYIVEVKSHANAESIMQLESELARFPKFFPEHRDKKLFGILAAVTISDEVAKLARKKGLYVGRISDEAFQLKVPAGFRAHSFQPRKAA